MAFAREIGSDKARCQVQPHTPLLWICAPSILGLLAGLLYPYVSFLGLSLGGLASLGVALALCFWKKCGGFVWGLFFCAGVFCVAWGYFVWRNPPLPAAWQTYPPREMAVEVEVQTVFSPSKKSRYPSTSGLGVVRQAPELAKVLQDRRVFFHVFGVDARLLPGSKLTTQAVVEAVNRYDAPFDRYLADNAVRAKASRGTLTGIIHPPDDLTLFLHRLNARAQEKLQAGFSAADSGVFVAMLLGQNSALTAEQKEYFSLTGTLHLFAISGLHVALIAGILTCLFYALRLPSRAVPWLVLPLLLLYVAMTGFAPSAMRAFTMIAFIWGARWIGRSGNGLSGLAASAICLLVYDPAYIGNAGFQLSYAVVAGILLYGVPLAQVLGARWTLYRDLPVEMRTWRQRLWARFVKATINTGAISLAAFVLSTPLCFEVFGNYAIGGVLINMLLVPASTVVLCAGMTSLFLGVAGAPVWLLCIPNFVGIVFTQAMARLTEFAVEYLPILYQRVEPSWDGLGAVSTLLMITFLLWWRCFAEGKGLSVYLWPLGVWGYLMALASF